MITGLDHVQVAAPPGCEEEARRFYGGVLGLEEIEKPEALRARGGVWFRLGPNELHVGVADPFAPARKAHPGIAVSDTAALVALAARLADAGADPEWADPDELPDRARLHVHDPFGNRLELLAPLLPAMYGRLAPWFHLITAPEEYAEEAALYARVIHDAVPEARTLLELGAGGGNNASHLKREFTCVLTDLSPAMLAESRRLNPECEHLQGDMRTLRLGRLFDAVLVHDAVVYLTREDELRQLARTIVAHLRPGGVALVAPDQVSDTVAATTSHGGGDAPDGRAARYLEWVHPTGPTPTSYEVDYAILVRGPGRPTEVHHDRHLEGVFPVATWLRVLRDAGLEPSAIPGAESGIPGLEHTLLVARRP